MPLAMTTELNAVNTILSAVGEPPVTTLDSQTNADAAIAQNILEEVNREVQTMGWHFNTQHDVEFSPNSDNLIVLPDDVVRIDVDPRIKKATEVGTVSSQTDNRDITQRGTEADEIRALALMKEFEMDTADHTIFDNFDTMRIVNRGDAQRGIV